VMAALIQRGRTGEGQHVQVSMLDCLVSMVAEEHFDIPAEDGAPMRTGNSHDRLVPFGTYACSDGFVAICAFRPEWMKPLLEVMGRPELLDDPRFSSRGPRMKNATALNELIEAWTRTRTTNNVRRALFEERGVPVVRVRTPKEVLDDPVLHERGAVMKLEHPLMGNVRAVGMGNPIRFSKAHAQFDQPAQDIGEANKDIYGGLLKMSSREIDDLRSTGVI
jgi:crotonobetainyl-CoA:carnitine CoA-transferase CaiB-like acyl-CoA transferase